MGWMVNAPVSPLYTIKGVVTDGVDREAGDVPEADEHELQKIRKLLTTIKNQDRRENGTRMNYSFQKNGLSCCLPDLNSAIVAG